jgi:hypothetical protein
VSSTEQPREKPLGYNHIGWFPETTTLSTDRVEIQTSRRIRIGARKGNLSGSVFLVLAHGTADEVAKVKDILQTTRPAEVALHAAVSAK